MASRSSPKARFLALIVMAVLLAAAAGFAMRRPAPQPPLALFTTLPIYWNEASGVSDLLAEDEARPWVRDVLEQRYRLQPLDLLEPAGPGKPDPLRAYRDLLIAQPRALSAGENVALDAWVRAGGRVLMFADPMLTAHSIHALGDARRPQDVALLSPILGHWGLALEFDDTQPAGEHAVSVYGVTIPVDLPGQLRATTGKASSCRLLAEGFVAQCAIGKGTVLVVADAALLDSPQNDRDVREAGLNRLLDAAFRD